MDLACEFYYIYIWILPVSSTTSTSGADDLGSVTYVVRPAVVLTGGNGSHGHVRAGSGAFSSLHMLVVRAQCSMCVRQSGCERVWSMAAVFLYSVSGTVPLAGGRR